MTTDKAADTVGDVPIEERLREKAAKARAEAERLAGQWQSLHQGRVLLGPEEADQIAAAIASLRSQLEEAKRELKDAHGGVRMALDHLDYSPENHDVSELRGRIKGARVQLLAIDRAAKPEGERG